jgi:hypothetical protein
LETIAPGDPSLVTVKILLAHRHTGGMLSRLRSAGLREQAKWIEALGRDEIRVTAEEAIAAEMLIGHGIGLAMGTRPDAAALDMASQLFWLFRNAALGFGRGIDISLASNKLGSQVLETTLRQRVEDFGKITGERPGRLEAELFSIIERHRVTPSIDGYWDEPPYYLLPPRQNGVCL